MSVTSTLSAEKVSGIWNRNLVAGATVVEIVMSHVMCHIVFMVIQVVEVLLLSFLVFGLENNGTMVSAIIIICLQSLDGIAYGIIIFAITSSTTEALFLSLGTFLPYTIISGSIWPVQGMTPVIRYISYMSPGTLASVALTNVFAKGYGLLHKTVWPGVAVSVAWTVVPCVVAWFLLRRK